MEKKKKAEKPYQPLSSSLCSTLQLPYTTQKLLNPLTQNIINSKPYQLINPKTYKLKNL